MLRSESPDAFDALCSIKITAHSSGNEGISITSSQPFPVLVTAEATGKAEAPAEVVQIRWNNDDRATLPADDPELVNRFYAAARKWVEVLRRPENEYRVNLQPGRPLGECFWMSLRMCRGGLPRLVFDNWRVLHGRSAFTGDREMCGGYSQFLPTLGLLRSILTAMKANMDDFVSRWKTLNFSNEEVMNGV